MSSISRNAGLLQGRDDDKRSRVHTRGILRLAPFIEREVEPQAALAQILHHFGLFHKDDLLARKRQATTDIRADRARAEGLDGRSARLACRWYRPAGLAGDDRPAHDRRAVNRSRFPLDVRTAIDHIRVFEGPEPTLAIIGHSAGGHLALWAAARRPGTVDLIVGLASVTDLPALADSGSVGAVDARRLLETGAPASVGAIPGKTFLLHGERDGVVPTTHSTRLSTEARVEVVPKMGHFHMLDPQREHWPSVVAELGKTLGAG